MKKDLIILDRVSITFGQQQILREVSLALEEGVSYALIGKSGSGKTTLLNLIAGFLKPDQGMVTINGEQVQKPRRETAFLFQDLGLFPWQRVLEAVSMPLKLQGQKKGIKEAAESLLLKMGLEKHKNKYPQELSGGELQRVALARTLIADPDIILMDEPTSALDAITKEELQALIRMEHERQQATLVFVTHDVEEAIMLGKYILILNADGTITSMHNSYYEIKHARQELGFYEECIKLRKLINMEKER